MISENVNPNILIKHLGPIRDIQIDLSNSMNLFIGPQASGKSTLGKIVYFFKKIRDYTIEYLCDFEGLSVIPENERYISYLKYIRRQYMDSFGTTRHYSRHFYVRYQYENNQCVELTLDEKGYAKFRFSQRMEEQLKKLICTAGMLLENKQRDRNEDIYNSIIGNLELKNEAKRRFEVATVEVFGYSVSTLYIPAGRSLLAVMSDQISNVNADILDLPMKDFIYRINSTKSRFGAKLDTIVADYVKTVRGQIKNADVEQAERLIKKILRADYVNDTDGEKLYIDQNRWVKLIYGSSGQQEALWILLLLFIIILENKKTYVIIEEPEAHLYPAAQRYVTELIALTVNSSDSQVMVTTHSPYIMTSANLLLQSAIVENKIRTTQEELVIPRSFRLNPNGVRAYKFDDEKGLTLISDPESGLMRSSEIDIISESINDDTEKLIDLELKYGL